MNTPPIESIFSRALIFKDYPPRVRARVPFVGLDIPRSKPSYAHSSHSQDFESRSLDGRDTSKPFSLISVFVLNPRA